MYYNTIHLMLSLWKRNGLVILILISKDEIHIIKNYFGNTRSYSSRFLSGCIGYNTYTCPRIVKRVNIDPIKGPVPKNDSNLYHKRD